MDLQSYPYVVFLPAEHKNKILRAIFGSKASVEILKFSLSQGIAKKIYQKNLMEKLHHSNKTIIGNLKVLTELGILTEYMEKSQKEGRVVWVKAYQLSDMGKWFALLIAEEKELSDEEKAEILQNVFRNYIRWAKNISEKLHVKNETLERIFNEEIKG